MIDMPYTTLKKILQTIEDDEEAAKFIKTQPISLHPPFRRKLIKAANHIKDDDIRTRLLEQLGGLQYEDRRKT
jgi:hypothetical protein